MGFKSSFSPAQLEAAGREGGVAIAESYAQAVEEALRGPGSAIPDRTGDLKRSIRVQAYNSGGVWHIRVLSSFSWANFFFGVSASKVEGLIDRTLKVQAPQIRDRTNVLVKRRVASSV